MICEMIFLLHLDFTSHGKILFQELLFLNKYSALDYNLGKFMTSYIFLSMKEKDTFTTNKLLIFLKLQCHFRQMGGSKEDSSYILKALSFYNEVLAYKFKLFVLINLTCFCF